MSEGVQSDPQKGEEAVVVRGEEDEGWVGEDLVREGFPLSQLVFLLFSPSSPHPHLSDRPMRPD